MKGQTFTLPHPRSWLREQSLGIKCRTALLAGCALAAMTVTAHAQAVPSTIEPQHIEKRFDQPREPRIAPAPVAAPSADIPAQTGAGGPSFTLNGVQITGTTVYAPEDLAYTYEERLGNSVSMGDLQTIANAITRRYRADGYILSRAVVPPQKVKGGQVQIQVVEGYVSNVIIEGDVQGPKSLLNAYLDNVTASRPLKADDLERYMLLADDLPGVTAKGVLRPAGATGAADLVVTISHDKWEGAAGVDNRGSRFLGRFQTTGVVAANSLFGQYDRTTLRGIVTGEGQELMFGDLTEEWQIGKEGTRLYGRVAATHTEPGSVLEPFEIEGDSQAYEISIMHPFIRARDHNLKGVAALTARNSETESLGVRIGKDKVRSVSAGVVYDFTDDFRGINEISFDATQGLDFLGATDDGIGRSRINGEHSFTRFNAEVTRIHDLGRGFSLFGGVAGQYALDPLLASEEFALGGAGYGRAYDGAEITGDHGAAAKLELRYGQTPMHPHMYSYQLYAFYDGGAVWNRNPAGGEAKKQTLTSTGLGARFNVTRTLSGSAELAFPLTRNVASERSEGEDPRLFVSVTKRF